MIEGFREWYASRTPNELIWLGVGFGGQFFFSMRFLVQWIMSEKAKKSVMPVAFWYFSLLGGLTLFTYACHKKDPVFILGQGTGLFIYARNLYFIHRERRAADHIPAPPEAVASDDAGDGPETEQTSG